MSITMKRPTKTVELCTDLSLQVEHEAAQQALAAAEQEDARDPRLGARPSALDAARRVKELEELMAGSVLVFTLEALPRKTWVELEAAHPPHEDDKTDAAYSVHVATFIDAAVPLSIRSVTDKTTGVAVEFAPGDWNDLADQMTNGQWDRFAIATFGLNRGTGTPDFSRAASRVIRNSESK